MLEKSRYSIRVSTSDVPISQAASVTQSRTFYMGSNSSSQAKTESDAIRSISRLRGRLDLLERDRHLSFLLSRLSSRRRLTTPRMNTCLRTMMAQDHPQSQPSTLDKVQHRHKPLYSDPPSQKPR